MLINDKTVGITKKDDDKRVADCSEPFDRHAVWQQFLNSLIRVLDDGFFYCLIQFLHFVWATVSFFIFPVLFFLFFILPLLFFSPNFFFVFLFVYPFFFSLLLLSWLYCCCLSYNVLISIELLYVYWWLCFDLVWPLAWFHYFLVLSRVFVCNTHDLHVYVAIGHVTDYKFLILSINLLLFEYGFIESIV